MKWLRAPNAQLYKPFLDKKCGLRVFLYTIRLSKYRQNRLLQSHKQYCLNPIFSIFFSFNQPITHTHTGLSLHGMCNKKQCMYNNANIKETSAVYMQQSHDQGVNNCNVWSGYTCYYCPYTLHFNELLYEVYIYTLLIVVYLHNMQVY